MSLTNIAAQIASLTAELDGRVRVDVSLTADELDAPHAFTFWVGAEDVDNQTDLLAFITGLLPAEGAGAAAQAEADIAATATASATQATLDTAIQADQSSMASVAVVNPQ